LTAAVSVVIPVRNDGAALARTLDALAALTDRNGLEVIVAAARPPDHATSAAAAARARLLWLPVSTRAELMNAGARAASAEILWFLHADSVPPPDAVAHIVAALADPRVMAGAFEHEFDEASFSLWAISRINRLRYRLTHNFYGDQGIFVRADTFRRLGEFRPLRLMEDLDFTRRARGHGRRVLVRVPLRTSGRRFLARGPWRTFAFIVWLLLLFTAGVDTERYAERWRGPANRPPGSAWPRGDRVET
jgi:rSAM/selenodomain-associated transferase 2